MPEQLPPSRALQTGATLFTFWSPISDQIGRRGGSLTPTVASRPEERRVPGAAPVAAKHVPHIHGTKCGAVGRAVSLRV